LRQLDDQALAGLEGTVLTALQAGYPVAADERRRLQAAPALRLVRLQLLVLPAIAVLGVVLALTAVPRRRGSTLLAGLPALILLPAAHIAVEQAVVTGSLTQAWAACLPVLLACGWLGLVMVRR